MVATKVLIYVLSFFFGGWGARQMLKLATPEMPWWGAMAIMAAGATLTCFVAHEWVVRLLPQ